MDPAYIGYIILLPVMYMFMNMIDSFNTYRGKDPCSVYLLCERVGDLEQSVSALTKLMNHVTDLNKEYVEYVEYVDALRYNKDHLELKDNITINRNDIVRLEDKIKNMVFG